MKIIALVPRQSLYDIIEDSSRLNLSSRFLPLFLHKLPSSHTSSKIRDPSYYHYDALSSQDGACPTERHLDHELQRARRCRAFG